ncbi:hypothetical protein Hdeb2414_s0260g00850851 [Helianthus debilis subsp. tardiflorus]
MFCLGLVVDLCSRIHLIIFCKEESKEMIVSTDTVLFVWMSLHFDMLFVLFFFFSFFFFLNNLQFQQSSTDIWLAICTAVKRALSLSDVAGEEVTGIGFAATCSLGNLQESWSMAWRWMDISSG